MKRAALFLFFGPFLTGSFVGAQEPPRGFDRPPPFFGPPGGPTIKLVKDFDQDGNGWLDREERAAAREHIKKERRNTQRRGGPGGFGPPPAGGPGGFGPPPAGGPGGPGGFPGFGRLEAGKPGPRVRPEDAPSYPDKDLYDPSILRTFFLEFDSNDWEAELQDFHGTDVEVPATLSVDGKKYANVGVRFRGMTSYMGVPMGLKRPLNVSVDLADPKQRLYGYKTLNLLNAHQDPSMMSSVLYSHIARQYIPCPKANFVKVVINGESWGVYANVQQFNKDFTREHYQSEKGARWKVSGSPQGDGGLRYLGENVEEYKRRYEIKSKDDPESWKALVELCRTLDQTPPEELEKALAPILALDEVLWFLAVDVALCNSDGYWTRASDYCLYRDEQGKFHVIPHDFNEAFRAGMMPMPRGGGRRNMAGGRPNENPPGGPPGGNPRPGGFGPPAGGPGGFGPPAGGPGGFGPPAGGPGGFGPPIGSARAELDPLVALDDPRKPLRSKLLAVPSLRQKYLENLRTIAEKSLDWNTLGPVVDQFRRLIDDEVKADTRKLFQYSAFQQAHGTAKPDQPAGPGTLRHFIEQRREFLLKHPKIKELRADRSNP